MPKFNFAPLFSISRFTRRASRFTKTKVLPFTTLLLHPLRLWRHTSSSPSSVARDISRCPDRLRQRYLNGCRLVAGCIPFRYRNSSYCNGASGEQIVEVLMITSASGPGLLFPKGGWEYDEIVQQAAVREAMEEAGVKGDLMGSFGAYDFKSRTLQDEYCPSGLCKAEMFPLYVKEEMETWPEHSTRKRSWLTIPEALECCRHPWMRKALEEGFNKWHTKQD
ncbi:uncharacterized protein [Phyllobates terribilis]|uniref:uncharacterized protein n=1 Tax=Phyllobates terribilis TaxID=111132 RepID=UPI003CCB24D1